MKGKLTNGTLYIDKELGNKNTSGMLSQVCYFSATHRCCSLSCPLFGDIISGVTVIDSASGEVHEKGTEIRICHGRTLTFSEFTIEK